MLRRVRLTIGIRLDATWRQRRSLPWRQRTSSSPSPYSYHSLSYLQLPDGRLVKVAAERFEAPEILFQPHLVDKECLGLSEQVFSVIQSADIDVRSDLYRHIVLSGGTTMFPGFPTRLEQDLHALCAERVFGGDAQKAKSGKIRIRVEDPPNRKHAVFAGGAVLADIMKDNEAFWLGKQEWEDRGPSSLAKFGGSSAH